MRILFFCLFLISCGGSLSSEQRKKMRENMEAKSIKKISEAELTEAGFAYSRSIMKAAEKHLDDRPFLDSLEKKYGVEIIFMTPSNSELRNVERQVIDAYTSGANTVDLTDNLQKMGKDSLLYTKPILTEQKDGSLICSRALGVRLTKKQVILSIK
ncbi:MAG TPA: hypothetical protein DGG95_06210 [Cytophagales bacterium]|jgi:hypothetical protein|nr:hypothetical protein [Cytophagales bacterium]